MNVAIIPARGGSKRIPRKNIKQFCGKPMIAWSIEVALESECFERVIVSTDDDEIASVARDFGAEVPFLRPIKLADDQTPTIPVIAHAINYLHNQEVYPKCICCIYATAPFIQKDDLLKAYDIFKTKKWAYVFSATTFPFPIQRAIKRLEIGGIEMFQPEHFETRSQDLEEAYHDAGQFYFGKPEAWLNNEKIFESKSEVVILPKWRVQDIDTYEDWISAEYLFNSFNKN